MNALLTHNLSVFYDTSKSPAISGISFAIKRGQIATIIGPNGSGKTTLIKAILGLLPFSGKIKVFDKDPRDVITQIGYIPQRFTFDSDLPLTVLETVSMPLSVLKKEEKKESVNQLMKLFGISNIKDKKLSEISGGQLQRVLLTRSMVTEPKILLLDEPESGVDIQGEQTLYHFLKKLVKEKGLTVVIASHELEVVYQYSDSVICLNKRMVCSGVPSQVITRETLLKLYGVDISLYKHRH